jgi:hypothetical protein
MSGTGWGKQNLFWSTWNAIDPAPWLALIAISLHGPLNWEIRAERRARVCLPAKAVSSPVVVSLL